jgi:hypothetical protein
MTITPKFFGGPKPQMPKMTAEWALDADRMILLESTTSKMNVNLTGHVKMSVGATNQKLYNVGAKRMTMYSEADTELSGPEDELKMFSAVPTGKSKSCAYQEFKNMKDPAHVRKCIEDVVSKVPSTKTEKGTLYSMDVDIPGVDFMKLSFLITDANLAADFHMRMNTTAGRMDYNASGQAHPGAGDLTVHDAGQFGKCKEDTTPLPMPSQGAGAEFLQCIGLE